VSPSRRRREGYAVKEQQREEVLSGGRPDLDKLVSAIRNPDGQTWHKGHKRKVRRPNIARPGSKPKHRRGRGDPISPFAERCPLPGQHREPLPLNRRAFGPQLAPARIFQTSTLDPAR
jgi:hypothetical protein